MPILKSASQTVWVISELYYPEETSTGFFLTQIAEGLAKKHSVRVLCGQPSYSARGQRAPRRERRRGVAIHRCWGTTFNKDRLLLRLVNLLTLSCIIFLRALFSFKKGDKVLVVTNPPLLPFAISLACRIRGAECLLLIHDVYPEVAIATGMLRRTSIVARLIDAAVTSLYRSVDQIIVLGRDMQELVNRKLKGHPTPTSIITNWADLQVVRPKPKHSNHLLAKLNLSSKFVVQYAGNLGRSHDVEGILDSARLLAPISDLHYLIVGSGAKKNWVERTLATNETTNVTALGHQPRHELNDLLSACDVALIAFIPGMAGVSVPSRMYNILAAGRPIIAVTEEDSELALVVKEERIGWVVPPHDPAALSRAVLEAYRNPSQLEAMGRRARSAAEVRYHLNCVISAYEDLLEDAHTEEFANTQSGRRTACAA